MKREVISVVLCCYNGEKYIEEQMESLKNQTRQPDEVLIFDDCSTDKTVEIIKKYIAANQLKTWSITVNENNKGWKTNFIDGLKKAKGEIIFPCDQDDIWYLDKIEKMAGILENNENILLLAGNYEAFYEGDNYQKVDRVFKKNIQNDENIYKMEANEKGVYILSPGCVMGIRKELLDISLKYMFPEYPHDALLWRNAMFLDGLYRYDRNVIRFRRHGENASDKKQHQKDQKLESIRYYIKVCDKLLQLVIDRHDEKKERILDNTKKFWELRENFYETRSIILGIRLLLFYHTYYLTWKASVGDLYIVLRNK
ncbi:glycosyltransferase [Lachnoclostridium sp. An181]|uniref:glycosyltransferase n=1 Tax=Lachnoclostridium sp. An181 TaxID=1965575 RepID=UPI000B3808E5|nr:glycosyltransferase [Lachnoclostridium sp. An181]OUP49752.1 hypothetical protein B5F18_06985 [Lachnoclostridium sp. An181]